MLLVGGYNRKVYKWEFFVFCMERDYVKGRFKLPLSLRIAVPVLSGFLFSLNVAEGFVEGWNYESMGKQAELTRKYEEKIESLKYVVDGKGLDDVVGGRDGN